MPVNSPPLRALNKPAYFKAIGYWPHSEQQWEFHNSQARFRAPICGRRFGKSFMSGTDAELDLFKKDARIWIVGPTYDLGEKEFRVVYNHIVHELKLGKEVKKAYNLRSGEMFIEMPWGARIDVKSADHRDGLVGEGLTGVIMSEAAKHQRSTWEKYIRPALADRHGWATFPTTPEGFNWVYDTYVMGQEENFPDYASWRYPSWFNPVVYPGGRNDAEILLLEKTSSSREWFLQEIAAEFTSFVGKIYGEFDENINVGNFPYDPKLETYMGFDFGYSNPFCALEIQITQEDDVIITREYYKKGLPTYQHGINLKERPNPAGWHCDGMFGDPAGADAIATLSSILGYVHSEKSEVLTGIEEIKLLLKAQVPTLQSDPKWKGELRPRLFIDKSCVNTIREMQQYRMKPSTRDDINPREDPHKYDDHAMDALRYVIVNLFTFGYRYKLSMMRTDPETERGMFTSSNMDW